MRVDRMAANNLLEESPDFIE